MSAAKPSTISPEAYLASMEAAAEARRDPRTRAIAAALSKAAIRPGVFYTDTGVANFLADLAARGYAIAPIRGPDAVHLAELQRRADFERESG